MAIVFPNTLCPICGNPIEKMNYFSTTAFLDQSHPLWEFSDAAIHWPCFLSWAHRKDFAIEYAKVIREEEVSNPFWHRIIDTNDLFIRYGKIGKLDVLLVNLATHLRIGQSEIDDWLHKPTSNNLYVQQELDNVASELITLGDSKQIALLLEEQQDRIYAKMRGVLR